MDTAKRQRDLALVERHLAELREAELYRPIAPAIVAEELALEHLRESILKQLWAGRLVAAV